MENKNREDLFDPTPSDEIASDSCADGSVSHLGEGDVPRELASDHPDTFTEDAFVYTEGEEVESEEAGEPVDIYAEPTELYEDADEDEILDADEEITEETVASSANVSG